MKIGTCVSLDTMEGVEQKLTMLRENGFETCQLVSWNPEVWTEENAKILNGLLEKNNIAVSAFWCGWEGPRVWNFYEGQLTLGLVPADYRQQRIKNLCDGGDFSHMLSC